MLEQKLLALNGDFAGDFTAPQLVEDSAAAIYMTDAQGRITYFNEAAAALWAHRPEIGMSEWCGSWRLRYPDGRPMPHAECPMAIAVKQGRALKGEAIAERPDGSLVPFLAFPSPIRDEKGKIVGAINILVDITDHKTAEEVTHRLAAIVESSDDAILSKSLTGVIASWNRGAEQLFGYTADEAIGKHVSFLIPADRKAEEDVILGRIRAGERVDHFDTIRQHKDGTLINISLTVSPVRNAAGMVIGASKIARNITDRKESENRIRMLMREVNHRVKNQFAVILSMIRETRKRATSTEDFEIQIRERIMALASSHDLLVDGDWRGADLRELIIKQVQPFANDERVSARGNALMLGATAVQYLGIAFHELATNSVKYGALSTSAGRVDIEWKVAEKNPSHICLTWKESGGPVAHEPDRKGFGRVVLERVAPAAVNGVGSVAFARDGLIWTLEAPIDSLT